MKVISLNVSLPQVVHWKGRDVSTGIFKEPVQGAVLLRRLDFDGDRQADLVAHGGRSKAAYLYPSEHYPYWKKELPGMELPWGMFGENLTTTGLDENDTHIGDQLRIGKAVVVVTQPRTPCYKLGIKFGRDDILKRFLESLRSGFYVSVREEGMVEAGDAIKRLEEDPERVSIAELNRLFAEGKFDRAVIERAVRVKALPDGWRDYLLDELRPQEP
ncbi:MAG TPA: MOSC domain-containing protein [Candidatus Limnocylindrales bacterium]|nr:MOSC domain-containing protein [Candidatus Limnocylindrales bacterium]